MPNVLLIEDSPDIRALVRLLLEQAGHPVAEGADGEEGLRLARAGGFDLILTDLAMPGLSGWDLVGTRKADPRTAQTPIVALTAHAMRGDRERALALGCDGFIAKPIDDESYARTVAKFLSAAATPATPPPSPAAAPVAPPTPATGRRVLVVDDNPGVRSLVGHLLSASGFRGRSAVDGAWALEEIGAEPPELVVLDVMLPGLDGYEATRRIKARADAPFLPVVLVTAGTVDRERGLEVGADDFLSKPIDRVELLARVQPAAPAGRHRGGPPPGRGPARVRPGQRAVHRHRRPRPADPAERDGADRRVSPGTAAGAGGTGAAAGGPWAR